MMAFRTLVVGTDFSAEAELAIQHATHIAKTMHGSVTLVHAGTIVDLPSASDELRAAMFSGLYANYVQEVREQLAAAQSRVEDDGVTARQYFVGGVADTALPRVATELGADLVAVGGCEHRGVKRALFGGVAERVVRLSRMSVLVAREPAPRPGYHRVLVPVEFTPDADAALASAELLAAPGATVEVVHFWEPPSPGRYAPGTSHRAAVADLLAASIRYAVRRAGRGLVERRQRVDLDLCFRDVRGSPGRGIPERAAEDVDLVILGGRRRGGGLRRALSKSVTEAVVRRTPCSVLVM